MNIKTAEIYINIIVVLFTYFICAPLVGYARAWAIEKAGDSTASQLGFLTLNPFIHVSKVWMVLLVWFQMLFHYMPLALGVYIPINPLNIQGKARGFRLALAYFTDVLVAVGIAFVAFFSMLAMYGSKAMLFLRQVVTLQNLAGVDPSTTTLGIVITWFLITFFIMASLMAAFSLIINCFHFVSYCFFEERLRNSEHAEMIMLFGPLLLLYVLIFTVRDSIMKFVVGIAYLLAYTVGVVN